MTCRSARTSAPCRDAVCCFSCAKKCGDCKGFLCMGGESCILRRNEIHEGDCVLFSEVAPLILRKGNFCNCKFHSCRAGTITHAACPSAKASQQASKQASKAKQNKTPQKNKQRNPRGGTAFTGDRTWYISQEFGEETLGQ